MARKPNKHDISLALAVGTDGDDVLIGSNDVLTPDTLDGGAGSDTFQSFQGADTIIGGDDPDGEDLDTLIVLWPSSNDGADFGVDVVSGIEKYDLSGLSHYSAADFGGVVDVRAIEWGDITFTPIAGGSHMHVEVVAGDSTWDVDMDILGATPVESQFIFA